MMTSFMNQSLPNIPIIFKSRDVLVIDKPNDLHIDGDYELTVEKLINNYYPEMENPLEEIQHKPGHTPSRRKLKFCHQLDYATSGILCLAFTRESCAKITYPFQQRTAQKQYLAVLRGHVLINDFEILTFIGEDPSDERKFRMRNFYLGREKTLLSELNTEEEIQEAKKSRESLTFGSVLCRGFYHKDNDTIPVTKVLLRPKTGRRHQLRLHTQLLGFPILGDATYSLLGRDGEEGVHRMMLHAWNLTLPGVFDDTLTTQDPFEEVQYFSWSK
ncbi:predicted protein [Naegleria gruberi]|uniref:Predicted protein n=1 Tax=Naegleria gruberi TaxID=5762 RepID=D2VX88_NAEGR|nr:uncharacterized protein NAEGRDRAFT_73658 [Naegleria gruberi]EFC38634.1 predicted protein [Naegleria gruberi]|eukprot:XP_002671378.1 predicted protein [Naegleria gruberi strain NEG-M]